MSIALDRVNSAPVINDDFSYEFKQWCSNTVDTLNEVIGDIEGELISRETIADDVILFDAVVNSLYIPTGVALTSIQLPITTANDIGAIIQVAGEGAGGWQLLVAAGQTIEDADVGGSASVSLSSSSRYDSISIILVDATTWVVQNGRTTGFVIV